MENSQSKVDLNAAIRQDHRVGGYVAAGVAAQAQRDLEDGQTGPGRAAAGAG
jgi:hypothetical protein